MFRMRHQTRFVASLVLAAVLVGAQAVVAAHALDHDAGLLQGKVCASCVAASQLASACIENSPPTHVSAFGPVFNSTATPDRIMLRSLVVRQRGPPPQF